MSTCSMCEGHVLPDSCNMIFVNERFLYLCDDCGKKYTLIMITLDTVWRTLKVKMPFKLIAETIFSLRNSKEEKCQNKEEFKHAKK